MINVKENIKFHNRYDLQLIDAATGRVKQEAHAENVVLDKIWDIFMDPSSGRYSSAVLRRVQLGTGTGEPSSSDTGVFTLGASLDISTSNTVNVSRNEQYPTSSYVYRISVPANSTYVGDYTEIAIAGGVETSSSYSLRYWSHAMFEDAEGNPITIHKTDLDVLVITFTVYVTLGASDDNFMWVHPSRNMFHALFRATAGYGTTVPLSAYSSATNNRLRICSCLITDGQTIIDWVGITVGNASSGYSNSVDDRTFGTTTQRLGTTEGNGIYYHGIIFGMTTSSGTNVGIGGVVFPNTNVFPNRPIIGASVGAGDGETTDFDVPIPYFIEGTDAIYVDGVKMARGTDYTLPSSSNVKKLACVQPNRHMRMISNGNPGGSVSAANVPFDVNSATATNPNRLFNSVGPMIFELLDTAPINRFNEVKFCITTFDSGGWLRYKSTVDSEWVGSQRLSLAGIKFIIEASSDRSAWEHVHTFDLGTPTGTYNRSWFSGSNHYQDYNMYHTQLATPKQFKYVRFTLDCTGATEAALATAYAIVLNTIVTTYSKDPYGVFTHAFEQNDTELPLHFANPPAAGAAITMDATINRPFKTDQHVIDIAMTLQF